MAYTSVENEKNQGVDVNAIYSETLAENSGQNSLF